MEYDMQRAVYIHTATSFPYQKCLWYCQNAGISRLFCCLGLLFFYDTLVSDQNSVPADIKSCVEKDKWYLHMCI